MTPIRPDQTTPAQPSPMANLLGLFPRWFRDWLKNRPPSRRAWRKEFHRQFTVHFPLWDAFMQAQNGRKKLSSMMDWRALETAFMARRPMKMCSLGTPLDQMGYEVVTSLVLSDHERGVRLLAAYRDWDDARI